MPFPGVITVPVAPYTGGSNEGSDYDKGSFDPVTGSINDNIRDGYIKDIVTDSSSGEQVQIDHDSSLDQVLSSAIQDYSESAKAGSAVNSYLELYKQTGDSGYLEKYLDDLIARENTASARDYEKMMSDTAVSRMIADIKKAGYNPWLALQGSVSAASSGSAVSAGQSGINNASISQSAKNNLTNNAFELIGDVLRAVAMIALFAYRKH